MTNLKIASWNVNSVKARLPNILEWLESAQPDVVLLQELKSQEENFPYSDFKQAGYEASVSGQKSWNGVAILSKHPIEDVMHRLPGDESDEQARYIEATIKDIRIASIYLPNGNPVDTEKYPYKLSWMDRLYKHSKDLLSQEIPVVLGGDYNIIPSNDDCEDISKWENDALFKFESRQKFRSILNLGYTEAFRTLHKEPNQYTFWDYQAGCWPRGDGIRIDHFLLSPKAADMLETCEIDSEPRGKEKASDHTPILINLSI